MSIGYSESTVRMGIALNKLGWALRDKKPIEARRHLADIKECCADLDSILNPEATVPPGFSLIRRLNQYLGMK